VRLLVFPKRSITLIKSFPSDDKVEGSRLSSAFEATCRVWKERFKVQYTYCGCPIPGDSIGERLSKLVKYTPHPTPFLVPIPTYYPGVTIAADCAASTPALQARGGGCGAGGCGSTFGGTPSKPSPNPNPNPNPSSCGGQCTSSQCTSSSCGSSCGGGCGGGG
jgi:hypothetical protein